MAASPSLQSIAAHLPLERLPRLTGFKPRPVPRAVAVPLAVAVFGLALWLAGHLGAATAAQTQAPTAPSLTSTNGQGDIPFIGDPIHDLTVWYSNMVHDACNADIGNLKGHFLTPLDPMTDSTVTDLYGRMLVLTIPLITLGGLILGYLIMVSRTSGESTYTVRAVTPRFIVGATLSVLGIFLVSVLAQFIAATDLAMVQVSIPGNAVGGPDAWPASGGVFQVLQNGGFDSHVNQGPGQLEHWCVALRGPALGGDPHLPPDARRCLRRHRAPARAHRTDRPRGVRASGDGTVHQRLAQARAGAPGRAVRVDDHLDPVQPSDPAARPGRQPADGR